MGSLLVEQILLLALFSLFSYCPSFLIFLELVGTTTHICAPSTYFLGLYKSVEITLFVCFANIY